MQKIPHDLVSHGVVVWDTIAGLSAVGHLDLFTTWKCIYWDSPTDRWKLSFSVLILAEFPADIKRSETKDLRHYHEMRHSHHLISFQIDGRRRSADLGAGC